MRPSFCIPPSTTDLLCRSLFIILGWAVFGLLSYKVANTTIENKIYDPFEILGIGSVSNDPSAPFASCIDLYWVGPLHHAHVFTGYFREGHQVPLQETLQNIVIAITFSPQLHAYDLCSHPDKVKLTGNDTAESVAARFVDITKAYKAYVDLNGGYPKLI